MDGILTAIFEEGAVPGSSAYNLMPDGLDDSKFKIMLVEPMGSIFAIKRTSTGFCTKLTSMSGKGPDGVYRESSWDENVDGDGVYWECFKPYDA